jgi:hypothetical protein
MNKAAQQSIAEEHADRMVMTAKKCRSALAARRRPHYLW